MKSRSKFWLRSWAALVFAFGFTNPSAGEDTSLGLGIHGFISQGFFKTSANNYLGNSKDGSFDFTEVGLTFTKSVLENMDIGAQLFARKLGPAEDFDAQFDWFFASYQLNNWFRFKVGRIKIPFGLYNDSSDIDSARVPILLPQSIYPTQNRNFLLAHTGAQIHGYSSLEEAGALEYDVYGGSVSIELPPVTSTTTLITSIDVPYIYGGRLMWETPLEGVRAGFTAQQLRLDFNLLLAGTPLSAKLSASQYIGSLEYSSKGLLLATEFSRWFVKTESNNQALVPESKAISERYYLMASYYLKESWAPGIYYSMYIPNVVQRGDYGKHQHDWALFLRYDVNSNWLFKFETHFMSGTAGLRTALNGGAALSSLKEDWALFMLKSTANF